MRAINDYVLVRHYFGGKKETKNGIILKESEGMVGPLQTGLVLSVGLKADQEIKENDYVLYEFGSCEPIGQKEAFIKSEYIEAIRED